MTSSIQIVLKAVRAPLENSGFRKRQAGIFTADVADDVIGWIGLNTFTEHLRPGQVGVNPVVGVRHQAVERLVAECLGEKFHQYIPPTMIYPLGYLMPEDRLMVWVFGDPDEDPDEDDHPASSMTQAIARFGVPYMRKTAPLVELCRALATQVGYEHQRIKRLPVALLLAGKTREASAALDESLEQVGDRQDEAALQFRRFAAALRPHIEQTS